MNKFSLYKDRCIIMMCCLCFQFSGAVVKSKVESLKECSTIGHGMTNLEYSVLSVQYSVDAVLNKCSVFSVQYADNAVQTIQQQIKGIVSDANGVLPGVTVSVKGKPINTITDENGQFTIAAAEGDVLVFSFIGYTSISVTITIANFNGNALNITMKEDATTLKEVVVNAGYYTVKDKERTGSISKITSKDIEKSPVSNVLAAMQGRMAGVDIIQDSGTSGGGFQIKIRGINSLRADGNSPLYIIDGVPISSELIGYSSITGGVPTTTSPLNSINPRDIESIEVLKDADATAIYGSRGANGVVLITTKKGKAGKAKFSFSSSTGYGKVTKFIDLMNTEQYLAMRRQGFANDGITTYPATAYDVNGTWDQNRYTDWQKELLGGTAEVNELQASVTGGSAQTQYLLSGTRRTETTVISGNFNYKRTSLHLTMNHSSDDNKFKLSFSGGYSLQSNKQPTADLSRVARNLAPNAPALYDADGNLNWENNTFQNPLAALRSYSTVDTKDLLANAVISYALSPDLTVKANIGYTDINNHEQRVTPHTAVNPSFGFTSATSSLIDNVTTRQSHLFEPQLQWKKDIGNSSFDLLVGGTAQQQRNSRVYISATGFASNSMITNLASANSRSISASDITEYKYQAFFGRINYNYKDKYIFNATGRRDGSSRFGPGKQFATFGAVGAAWIFSNENFLKDNSVLSFGKLRTSYGTSGNDQIGDYQFLDTYGTNGLNYQGVVGLEPIRLYNPQFGWESSTKFEAALETGFLKDRLFVTLAWYKNRSSNQLVGIPLPGTTGFTSINGNLNATVENRGIEGTLRTLNFNGKDFKWSTNITLSAARNELISFSGLASSTYANRYIVGQSTSIIKVYEFTGVNPLTGLYEVTDMNGDGIYNSIGDKQKTIDMTPDYFGGFQNQIQYKQWQLDFLFQFVKQKTYNYTPNSPGGTMFNQSVDYVNTWQQADDNVPYQMNTSGTNVAAVNAFYRYIDSDAMVVDGSYIRLKNISLSYDLPLKLKGISCKLLFTGQNVLTFTPYKGGDPEFKFTGYLPPLRTFTGGVQLNF